MNIHLTNHALKQCVFRKILPEEVELTVYYPDITKKKHGKYYYIKKLDRGIIEVVCQKEQTLKIITAYWI